MEAEITLRKNKVVSSTNKPYSGPTFKNYMTKQVGNFQQQINPTLDLHLTII